MTTAGWRLVPVEATEVMTETGVGARQAVDLGVWAAMLAAAPDPLQDERLIELVAREIDQHTGLSTRGKARSVLALFRGERP